MIHLMWEHRYILSCAVYEFKIAICSVINLKLIMYCINQYSIILIHAPVFTPIVTDLEI